MMEAVLGPLPPGMAGKCTCSPAGGCVARKSWRRCCSRLAFATVPATSRSAVHVGVATPMCGALHAMRMIVLDTRWENWLTPCWLILRKLSMSLVRSRQVLQQRYGTAKLAGGRCEPQECKGGQAAQRAAPSATGAGWVHTQMGRGAVGHPDEPGAQL